MGLKTGKGKRMSRSGSENLAPIAMFVFNRRQHTEQSVAALALNDLAAESDLFVFSDGPRSEADREKIQQIRDFVKTITGFKSVTVIERAENLGCAKSIASGVSEIVNRFGQIIVVEDDIVTSPHFLRYMNEALEFYRDNDRIACIHGYCYPVKKDLPETFFVRGADIWGWATWKRAWDLFEPDAQVLLDKLEACDLTRAFNYDGAYDFIQMLRDQVLGRIDTWDVQWHASVFLQDKLTLYPGRSLVTNIGNDNSGTHSGTFSGSKCVFHTEISREPVTIRSIPVEDNQIARKEFRKFFSILKPSLAGRVWRTIKRVTGTSNAACV
jgi:hypothetical protein